MIGSVTGTNLDPKKFGVEASRDALDVAGLVQSCWRSAEQLFLDEPITKRRVRLNTYG